MLVIIKTGANKWEFKMLQANYDTTKLLEQNFFLSIATRCPKNEHTIYCNLKCLNVKHKTEASLVNENNTKQVGAIYS